jgi:hypothetical protein
MAKLKSFATRVKAVLLMDTDQFFALLERRRRRRFREHPVLMHLVYIGGYASVLVAGWAIAGPTVVIVFIAFGGAAVCLSLVVSAVARLRHR